MLNFFILILIYTCIYAFMSLGQNLITGYSGMLSLCAAGFFAIGSYTTAILTTSFGWSFWATLPVAALLSALMGVLIGLPTLRLKGDYLAIITLACGEVIKNILLNLDITGGASGYIGIPRYTNFAFAYIFAIITVYATYALIKSRFGRVVMAVRDNEIAAESSGVNINRVKMLAFVFAAFFAGVAGSLYAHLMTYVDPGTFNSAISFNCIAIVVLGGLANFPGTLISALFLSILPEYLRQFEFLFQYRMIAYGAVLVIVMWLNHSIPGEKLKSTVVGFFRKILKKKEVEEVA